MISSRQSERCICCHVSGNLSHKINEQSTSHRPLWNLISLNSQRSTSLSFGDLFAIYYSADSTVPCCRCTLALRGGKKNPPSPYAAEIFHACPSFHGDVRLSVVCQSGFCCPSTIRPSARQPVIRASHRGKSFMIARAYAMKRLLQWRQT